MSRHAYRTIGGALLIASIVAALTCPGLGGALLASVLMIGAVISLDLGGALS